MSPLFRPLFSILLLSIFTASGFAQSLGAEQAKLAKLERQNENLLALNSDIEQSLTGISTEIANIEAQAPPSSELEKATTALASAQAANNNKPSVINKDKLEIAQFKHALAVRKHNKGNPALSRLKKEQEELNKAINTNVQKIDDNKALITSQTALIKTLRSEEKSARQAWRRKQEQQKQQAEDKSLQQAEQERSEALAEVKRLRALLAQQASQQEALQQQRLKEEEQTAQATATPTGNTKAEFESFVFLANSEEISAEKSRIRSAIRSSNDASGAKFSKFISIKTYNNGAIVARETKRLNHIGGDIYQNARVTMPVKDTLFVVGQDEWRVNLPSLDDGVPEGEASSYTITLDLRNRELPFLTIYPD